MKIELEKIPSIPHALLRLLEVIRDPDSSFSAITEIIQTDPALTARVMSTASSGEFFQWRNNNGKKDLNRLVVAIGLKRVKTLAINSVVQQFFSQFNVDNENLLAHFWQTSMTTAIIAQSLAHITSCVSEDEAYIVGLLHNIGELVCFMHDADTYTGLKQQITNKSQVLLINEIAEQKSELELNFIGTSIPEIGHLIIQGFEPGSIMADAVLYQRESAEQLGGSSYLIQVINMASKLAMLNDKQVNKVNKSENQSIVFEEISQVFGLNQPLLEEMMVNSHSEFLKAAKNMGISVNETQEVEFNNEQVQLDLADNVRTIALSSSLQQIKSEQLKGRTEQELIEQIIQNLKLLFGLSHFIYLTYVEDKHELKGVQIGFGVNSELNHPTNKRVSELVSQLKLSMDSNKSLPVQAIQKGVPLTSSYCSENTPESHCVNKESMAVVDRQVLSSLGSQELLCVPLLSQCKKEKYGVIVAGLSLHQLQKIKCEKGLLYEFSRAASEVIEQELSVTEQINNILEEKTQLQTLEIRKLVHEANNPLGVIRNYLQILSMKLEDSKEKKLQGQLDILMSEVERVGNIVLKIRDIPKQLDLEANNVDINLIISQLLSIFKESLFLKSKVVEKLTLDDSIPIIKSNADNLKQILTNLFKNAVEAMPEGGELSISTRDHINVNGEPFIELRVLDSGPGIPKEILSHLFHPVKSTKSGEHSGLGLSIIKNLVNDLGGTIGGSNHQCLPSVSNGQENHGAEFVILLPRKPI
ncbi:MAG: HDOD domain-containing protein [Gammaproteobacteria bacterium]|nr:HDOD domain-containing protein [Gammaproteobacteria bacterium]